MLVLYAGSAVDDSAAFVQMRPGEAGGDDRGGS